MFWEKLSLHNNKSIDTKILTPSTNLPTFRLVTVSTFLRVNLQKSPLDLQGRIKSPAIAFIAIAWSIYDTMYKKGIKNFSLLANNRKLEPLPKNSSDLLGKRNLTSLLYFGTTTETNFSMQHSTLDQRPCSSLASYNWSGALLWPSCYATAVLFELLSNFPSRCCSKEEKSDVFSKRTRRIFWQRFKFSVVGKQGKVFYSFFGHRIINWSSNCNKSDRWTLDSTLDIERRFLKVYPEKGAHSYQPKRRKICPWCQNFGIYLFVVVQWNFFSKHPVHKLYGPWRK